MNEAWLRLRRVLLPLMVFVMAVAVIVLVVSAWQLEQRSDAIDEIREAAVRIEDAATHTEEVLVEVVSERQTPAAIEQSQRVRQALDDITAVRRLICQLPELANDPLCNQ